MKKLSFIISVFFLCATSLALATSCQSQPSLGPSLPIEVPPTQASPVETPNPTPPPTPGRQDGTGNADKLSGPFPYEKVGDLGETKSDKFSGIVFYPPRETILAVTDNGQIIEIKTDGSFIRRKLVRSKADFEGITYSPATEMLYVAVEGEEVILEVNPESLEAVRDLPIDRMFGGDVLLSPEGNGIEGITFVPASESPANGSFYLVNQSDELAGPDPSIVIEVEIDHAASEPQARIIRFFSVGVTDLSGIQYAPSSHRLLIVSDGNNLLLEVDLTGQVLETYPLPGKKQEGVTVDGDGFLYIAQDDDTALLKFTPLDAAGHTNQ